MSSLMGSDCLLSAPEAPLTRLFNGGTAKDSLSGNQNHSATEAELRLEASKDGKIEG